MSHRERNQPRAHSDDHENVKTVLEQISFEEVSPRSAEQRYYSHRSKGTRHWMQLFFDVKDHFHCVNNASFNVIAMTIFRWPINASSAIINNMTKTFFK